MVSKGETSSGLYLWSGISLGLLIGFLAGLSTSPVTGALLGTLSAVFVAFLGLGLGKAEKVEAKGISAKAPILVVGFSITCLLGVLTGLFFRAHQLASPSISDLIQEYRSVGFDKASAKALALYVKLGLVPKDLKEGRKPEGIGTNLFAGNQESACASLDPDDYAGAGAYRDAFVLQGGHWKVFAEQIERDFEETLRMAILRSYWKSRCRN